MVVDQSHLVAVKSAAAVLVTRLDTEQRRLVSGSRTTGYINALAADDDAIYWIGQLEAPELDESGRYQLWRSMRETGESVMLADVEDDSYSYGELVVLNEDLFFLRRADEGVELVRIAKDGSSTGAVEAVQVFPSVNYLRTDGKDLFFSFSDILEGETGFPVMAELHIVRVDGVSLEAETLFETDASWDRDLAVGDGPYVYWTAWHLDDEKVRLWRGLSDGSGVPQELGAFEAFDGALTQHDGEPVWIANCMMIGSEGGWMQRSHIVKRTD